jgi:S1-C subfamily serine protease
LIVEARAGETVALSWPSEWRKIELDTPPGKEISIVVDRAGAELELTLTTVARVAPPARIETQRWREEQRVGVVVRSATEVEARAASLGPGGGAVVVGLSADSPWRAHDPSKSAERELYVVYGDLIRAVDGVPLASPQVLLDKIRAAPSKSDLELSILRAGNELTLRLPVSRRAQELKDVSIPLLYSFERDRDASTTSILLGLIRWRSTPAAWDFRLLWFISFSGGDSDHLETVSE